MALPDPGGLIVKRPESDSTDSGLLFGFERKLLGLVLGSGAAKLWPLLRGSLNYYGGDTSRSRK